MRILQLTETLHAGGAETFVVRLSNALVESGHEVTVAVAVPVINPAIRRALDPRIGVEILPVPRWRLWSKADSALRRLGRRERPLHWRQRRWLDPLVRRLRPDVIHSHLLNADLLAQQSRVHAPGARHIVTIHGDYPMFLAGDADSRLLDHEVQMKSIARGADEIVGVAAEHLELFRDRLGADDSKLHLIYNGYSLPESAEKDRIELGLPPKKFLFGMVARGIREKGWDEAIAAFELLERDDAALILVGEGPHLDELRDGVSKVGVHFTGFAPDPSGLIRHFDVGLLPSFYAAESLPTVIIEYLAWGKPVIATDIGEVATMLSAPDGSMAGELVPPRSIEPLAEAMDQLLNETEIREGCAASARAAFAKFDMATCLERYLRLFAGVSSNSSTKACH